MKKNGKTQLGPAPTGIEAALTVSASRVGIGDPVDVSIQLENYAQDRDFVDIEVSFRGDTILSLPG